MHRRASLAFLGFAIALLFSGVASAADLTVTNQAMTAWLINGQANPPLTLHVGTTYNFVVNAPPNHPFWIKTAQTLGSADAFNEGVTNNGVDQGTVTFTVPADAPASLFYQCGNHTPMTGAITILPAGPVPAVGPTAAVALMLALFGLGFVALRRRASRA